MIYFPMHFDSLTAYEYGNVRSKPLRRSLLVDWIMPKNTTFPIISSRNWTKVNIHSAI